jgi:hypothetical protein
MNALARYARLPAGERRLIEEAVALCAALRLALRTMPFAALRRCVALLAKTRASASATPERVAWAVEAAGRRVGAACLAKAMAARVMLARRGHEGELRIGVARGEGGGIQAHAWVEQGGRVLVGSSPVEYRALRGS